jgi:hypothetical protein
MTSDDMALQEKIKLEMDAVRCTHGVKDKDSIMNSSER